MLVVTMRSGTTNPKYQLCMRLLEKRLTKNEQLPPMVHRRSQVVAKRLVAHARIVRKRWRAPRNVVIAVTGLAGRTLSGANLVTITSAADATMTRRLSTASRNFGNAIAAMDSDYGCALVPTEMEMLFFAFCHGSGRGHSA